MRVTSPPLRGTRGVFAKVFPLEEVCVFCQCCMELEDTNDIGITDKIEPFWTCTECGNRNPIVEVWERETVIAEVRGRVADDRSDEYKEMK